MALKKVVRIRDDSDQGSIKNDAVAKRKADEQRRKARTLAKQQQAAEKIASTAAELARTVSETAASQEELSKATEQIASGAEQASSASQETLAAVIQINGRVKRQQEITDDSKAKANDVTQRLTSLNKDIVSMVNIVAEVAVRQTEAAEQSSAMQEQVAKIGGAAKAVTGIADQINLLALNAAIEAGRAGTHGKGFAVVADSVRTLAEEAEKNASAIQELVERFQESANEVAQGVKGAADAVVEEKEKSEAVMKQLEVVIEASENVSGFTVELNGMAGSLVDVMVESQKAGEAIAAASEEQSAACEEALNTLQQQAQALAGAEQAASALDEMADELKNSTDMTKSAEEVAASAEELSSNIEELSRSADEITRAIEEINRGAEQQAAAVEEATANMARIEKAADDTNKRAKEALDKGEDMARLLKENLTEVEVVADGLDGAVKTTEKYLTAIDELEELAKRTTKIVDIIAKLALQTNMLSVTGAVEAARAGEFGRGFAVVSTDIKNLAADADENSDQTGDMVDAISIQLENVRSVLQKNIVEVSQIAVRARATTNELRASNDITDELIAGGNNIVKGVEEVTTAVAQIKKALEQVAAMSEQATTATSQATKAARQQAGIAAKLAESIEEIASIADELQSA